MIDFLTISHSPDVCTLGLCAFRNAVGGSSPQSGVLTQDLLQLQYRSSCTAAVCCRHAVHPPSYGKLHFCGFQSLLAATNDAPLSFGLPPFEGAWAPICEACHQTFSQSAPVALPGSIPNNIILFTVHFSAPIVQVHSHVS
jgi:hypothetical protein